MAKMGWHTPDEIPARQRVALLTVPDDEGFYAMLKGALVPLFDAENFEAIGAVSEEDAAAYWRQWDYEQNWLVPWNPYTIKLLRQFSAGLIGYWPLWEALSAARARDFSGYAYHGTPTAVTWEAAGIGDGMTAVSLPGTAARITTFPAGLITALNMDLGSVSLWADSVNWFETAFRYHFSAYTGNPALYLYVRKDSPNTYTFGVKVPGVNEVKATASIAAWAATGYHHIAATWDATADMILYLDGVEAARIAHPGTFGAAKPNQLTIGAQNATGPGCNGKLAHVALWNRVLTPGEAAYLAVS